MSPCRCATSTAPCASTRPLRLEIAFQDETTIELRTPGCRDALTLVRSEAPEAGSQGGILHFGFRLLEPMAPDDIAIAVTQAGGTVQDKGQFVLGEPYVFAQDPDGYLLEIFFEP
jgi:hypothetical protein